MKDFISDDSFLLFFNSSFRNFYTNNCSTEEIYKIGQNIGNRISDDFFQKQKIKNTLNNEIKKSYLNNNYTNNFCKKEIVLEFTNYFFLIYFEEEIKIENFTFSIPSKLEQAGGELTNHLFCGILNSIFENLSNYKFIIFLESIKLE